MLRDTQRAAFMSILEELAESQARVLGVLLDYGEALAGFEIAILLGRPLHAISGRLTELSDLGFIRDSGEREINPITKRPVIKWAVVQLNTGGAAV